MERVEEDSGIEPRGRRETWRERRRTSQRFLERYERREAERRAGRHHPLKRPIRVTTGVTLILAGVAIGWLPGPGFVILAFPGALLVASEWRRAALIMDRVEHESVPWVRRARAKLRGGPRPEWVEEDPAFWGVWEDRRSGAEPDSGERRRRSDAEDVFSLEHDPDDDVRSA